MLVRRLTAAGVVVTSPETPFLEHTGSDVILSSVAQDDLVLGQKLYGEKSTYHNVFVQIAECPMPQAQSHLVYFLMN